MKKTLINLNAIKKLNNINLVKRVIPGLTAFALSMTLSGCEKEDKGQNIERKTDNTSSIVVVDDNIQITDNIQTQEVEEENVSDYYYSGIFTENDWNNYVDKAYKELDGTNININKESFNTALLILNQEYLQNTNEEVTNKILENYFVNSEGVNTYDDMNKLFELLSLIRENNTTVDTKFYSLSNLLIPEFITLEDETVISSLEVDAKLAKRYYENDEKVSEENVKNIFESAKEFGMGKANIKGYTQADLSLGATFITENLIQEISVMSQNVVSEESRNELDERLNSINSLNSIEKEWYALSEGVRKYVVKDKKDTKYDKLLSSTKEEREELYNYFKVVNDLNQDDFNNLYAIANIDYFLKDTKTTYAFEELYGKDFDLTESYYGAEDALYEILHYNFSQPYDSKLDISKLFIDNEVDKYSVAGISYLIGELQTSDVEYTKETAEFILDYSKYDNDVTINVTNNTTGEVVKYPKASLSKGATQIVNWMTYFAMVTYSENINDSIIVESTKGLVDGHNELSNIYAEIVVMLDEKCSYKNEEEYSYKLTK